MDFNFTEEQTTLQDTLRRFVQKDYSFEARKALLRSTDGFSRAAWKTYAELGILALPFPEDVGGLGGTAVDTMVVMQALSGGLVLEPYLSTVVLAGTLVDKFGTEAQRQNIVTPITEGTLMLSLAHGEPAARYALSHVATTATKSGDGWTLSGHKSVVLGAPSADHLLVSARTAGGLRDGEGVSLFLVDAKANGLTIDGYATQDGQRAGDVRLDGVKVGADALVGVEGGALPAIELAMDRANAALAAEAVGVMTALSDATVQYLKDRKQFGQPIGKFQVLQHRAAEMAIATEQARSMAILAAVNVDSDDADTRRRAVAGAKAYVCQQARFAGQAAVQMHGGMGVVDEMIVSHYFKRLTMIAVTLGDVDHHLARYSDLLEAA